MQLCNTLPCSTSLRQRFHDELVKIVKMGRHWKKSKIEVINFPQIAIHALVTNILESKY